MINTQRSSLIRCRALSHVGADRKRAGVRWSTTSFQRWVLIRQSDIQKGDCLLKGFLSVVGESVEDRECTKFEKGLDIKVKLSLYRTFNKEIEFKKYLHGASDTGSRLIFWFRSGTHGLNEELGRHRGREGERSVSYARKSDSVSHVVWECPAYSSLRSDFMCKLQELLGDISASRVLIALREHHLCWVVSCGRGDLVLCLILSRATLWMFRKAKL